MRDFIADNLDAIEPGLHIRGPQDIEVACMVGNRSIGRIDILASDFQMSPVVIECKRVAATPHALGQLLGYMAWVHRYLAQRGREVRGLIVTTKLTARLDLALSTFESANVRVVVVPSRDSIPFPV